MGRLKDWKIRKKLLTVALSPLLLVVASLTFYFIQTERAVMLAGLAGKAEPLGDLLVEEVGADLAMNNVPGMARDLNIVAKDRDFHAALVLDGSGHPVASLGAALDPDLLAPLLREAAVGARTVDGEHVLLRALPVRTDDRIIGTVILGLDKRQIQDEIHGMIVHAMGIATAGLALALLAVYVLAGVLVRPLLRMAEILERVAAGDLTPRIGSDARDEVGRMGQALDHALDTLGATIAAIVENAARLERSAEELNLTSKQIGSHSESASSQARAVATAAAEVSANVQTVRASMVEMGAAIQQVSRNAADGARVASSAVQFVERCDRTMNKLGDSSSAIGQVVKVINAIAGQTNLLALNATIEAARAGSAGKGFAVVANEVKELAKETARATDDIGRQIAAIQADTAGAIITISEIGKVIVQINDLQNTIAGAVEEQVSTIHEIGLNVGAAAELTTDIAHNIEGAAATAADTARGASSSREASAELTQIATELRRSIAQFRQAPAAPPTGTPPLALAPRIEKLAA